MDGRFYLMMSLAAVLLVLAAVTFCGRGDWLIAGYNTAGRKEKEQYHIGRLRLLVGLLCLFVTAVLLLDGVYGLSGFFTIILLPVVLAVVVLANTWAKKR